MTKRIFTLIVSAFVILIFQSIPFASATPIFGPNKYIREKGRPEEFKETFTLCAISGTYKLIVDNGTYTTTEEDDDDDEKDKGKDKDKKDKDKHKKKEKDDKKEKKTRVSVGEIEINGEEIIEEDDFKKRLARVERTITLPQGENLIEIEVKGKSGAFITVTIECISGCLEPKITFSVTGAVINKTKTIVQGNLSNLNGEAGVIIQSSGTGGQVIGLAQTQGNNFAGIIPLQQGQNTITVQATDACGYKAADTITINTTTLEEKIRLTATPSSGILNTTGILPVTIEAESTLPNPVSNYTWDLNGDGTPEQTGAALSKVTANYQYAGLYFPKVTITDTNGNTYEETTIINVLSREEMDALLKGKWDGMKGGLSQGNVEKALGYFHGSSQEKYREIFQLLKNELPTIVANMQEVQLIYVQGNVAKYRIRREQEIKGILQTITYYIYFTRDENGLWKIESF